MPRSFAGIRADLRLSQTEMAEKLGVPIATYQRYERLEVKVPTDITVKIANMVGIIDVREIKFSK